MDAAAIVENIVNGVVVGLIYAIVAVGFSLIFGVAKIMVFTHGEMYMLGAVSGFYLIRKLGFSYPVSPFLLFGYDFRLLPSCEQE